MRHFPLKEGLDSVRPSLFALTHLLELPKNVTSLKNPSSSSSGRAAIALPRARVEEIDTASGAASLR